MSVLVGKQAPGFTASAIVNGCEMVDNFTLADYRGKDVVLFFYPLDFTFVCPTELHAFQSRLIDFHKRGVEVIAVSVDSKFSHFAWLTTDKKHGGIKGVTYPVVSDLNKSIAAAYDVLVEGAGIAYRGLFLIDKKGVVRHQLVNDLPLGRSIDEALRMVDALQFFEKYGEVCPANWSEGEKTMKPDQGGLLVYFAD